MIFEIILFLVTLGIYIWGLVTSEKKKWWLIGGGVGLVLGLLPFAFVLFIPLISKAPFLYYTLMPGLVLSSSFSGPILSYIILFLFPVMFHGCIFGLASKRDILAYVALIAVVTTYILISLAYSVQT